MSWSVKCIECDYEIADHEEYIQFLGDNYCEECFDTHRVLVQEEGEEYMCECCGNTINDGWYYRFDDDIYCEDCVKEHMYVSTPENDGFDYLVDKRYEESLA